jgi:hypothetical protein
VPTSISGPPGLPRGDRVKRREFITLLGGLAVSSLSRPLTALAQQRGMPVVGFVNAGRAPDRLRAFQRGLKRDRLCRGSQRGDRIPLGGGPK